MACQCPLHAGLPDAAACDSQPFWQHAVAGSAAGVMEHVGMYPIDTVKTRIQASPVPLSVRKTFHVVLSETGYLGFMRGSMTIGVACIPAHCSMFMALEFAKGKLLDLQGAEHQPVRAGVCGAISALAHDSVITPADVVKQRLQLGGYRGFNHCVLTMLQHEGASAFFRSLPTTLLMNIPNMGLLVAANESLKRCLNLHGISRTMPSETPLFFLCAGLSGAFASAVTTPLDVVKTRLQTQGHFSGCEHTKHKSSFTVDTRYRGIISTALTISRSEGVAGFFRGLGPRVALATPAAAMCWGTYEVILRFFSQSGKVRADHDLGLGHHHGPSHGFGHDHGHGHSHGPGHDHGHGHSHGPGHDCGDANCDSHSHIHGDSHSHEPHHAGHVH